MAQPAELIFCPNEQCSFRLNHGRPAEYRPGFERCSDCGTSLTAGSAAEATVLRVVEAAPPLGKLPWSAIAVTAVAPLTVVAADWILLPGLDQSVVRDYLDNTRGSRVDLSLGALGLAPYVAAFAIVELVAALVPRWRNLRTSGVGGRERLGRAVAIVGILFALWQGLSVARWFERMSVSSREYGMPALLSDPGVFSVFLIAGSLAATAAVFALVAGWVTRLGVMNGWAALLLSLFVVDAVASMESVVATGYLSGVVTPASLLMTAIAFGGVVFGTAFLTQRGQSGVIRHPAGGITAALQSGAILGAAISLFYLLEPGAPDIEPTLQWYASAALLVPLSVAFAVLWNHPGRVAEVLSRADAGVPTSTHARAVRGQLPKAIAVAIVLNGAIALSPLLYPELATGFIELSATAFATAFVLDLVAELRSRRQVPNLVSIWPMHRTYAVAPVAQALEKAGIFTFIRGERFRALAPFLDSYVPMEVFVPEAEQERARQIVASILAPERASA